MKKQYIAGLLLIAAIIVGCKQDDWLDWKAQNELWLQNNATKDSIVTTPTGLQYKCILQGNPTSAKPDNSKTITMSYEGYLINGYQFDASDSYTTYVSSNIQGFIEGLKKMNEFGEYWFYIPYSLGYKSSGKGVEGNSSYIPPYSTLIFHVRLQSVN